MLASTVIFSLVRVGSRSLRKCALSSVKPRCSAKMLQLAIRNELFPGGRERGVI